MGATTMLIRHSNTDVGAKGEEYVDVNPVLDAAGKTWVFDRAEILIERQRFANVQFASLPKSGCLSCDKISVRWYHEPTGHIRFRVLVWRVLLESEREDDLGNLGPPEDLIRTLQTEAQLVGYRPIAGFA